MIHFFTEFNCNCLVFFIFFIWLTQILKILKDFSVYFIFCHTPGEVLSYIADDYDILCDAI